MSLLNKIRDRLRRKAAQNVPPLEREGLEELDCYGNAQEGDRKVIEQLLKHGADLSKSRHVVHYLYFAQPDDREKAYGELEAKGYETHPGVTFPESEHPYSLKAERVGIVNDREISAERELLTEVAERLNGEYDGWEAALD